MLLARVNGVLSHASPGVVGTCSGCDGEVSAKCGTIKVWHWAHRAADCDTWAEPESVWHRDWKSLAPIENQEVSMERDGEKHRADCVVLGGAVLELQASPISVEAIKARETFYGRMAWLFRCNWSERLEFPYYLNRQSGRGQHRGFWWKHGAPSQLAITKPLFWDIGEEVWRVEVERRRWLDPNLITLVVGEWQDGGWRTDTRITGRIVKKWSRDSFIRDVFGALARMPMRRAVSTENQGEQGRAAR